MSGTTKPGHIEPEALLQVSESLGQLVDLCAGHRAKLEAAGFSPTMAEAMAGQLHGAMVQAIGASR